jgi:putative pyruvate formate lyase activating enzyme
MNAGTQGPPSYIELLRSGELERRAKELSGQLAHCRLCPRDCGVNRREGERGVCGAGYSPVVSSAFPHFGEEPELVGTGGSGTIFMTHCNLRCVFCQNDDISHGGEGREVTPEELAECMIALQDRGCHNINFVTPTHFVPQIVTALVSAARRGLSIPLVYNTGGYDSIETIRALAGIFDIYMPDYKFADEAPARRYMDAPDYPGVIQEVITEMHRQVGVLETDGEGIARRGLLIRHLVMPGGLAGTDKVVAFIAGKLSKDTYVNLMDQYHPCHRAHLFPEIARRIAHSEYDEAVRTARKAGLSRGFQG